MAKRNLRRYAPAFKAKVAIEAAKERESLAQLGQRFSVHPVMVGEWKKQLLEKAELAFAREARGDAERAHDDLLKKIGELTVERDFLARGLRRSR